MSEDVKDRILSAAVELFMKQGFAATSVRAIGDRANVGQSSLYHHAKSKMQLLYDIHRRFLARLEGRLQSSVDLTQPASVQLRGFIGSVIWLMQGNHAEITIFLREGHNLSPDLYSEIRTERDRIDGLLDDIINTGIASGEFDQNGDVHVSRLAILGMCNWSYQWFDEKGRYGVDELTQLLTEFALHGLSRCNGDS